METRTADKKKLIIATIAIIGIIASLCIRFIPDTAESTDWSNYPLFIVLLLGGTPLVLELAGKMIRFEFGSDLLAGISIVTAIILGEYLAASLVVLMLSGGEALESYAVERASSALSALAKRMPQFARRKENGTIVEVAVNEIKVNDLIVVLPHELCPVDGVVTEGHGTMDESFLTGEPYMMSKTPGSRAISGAINGESAITIQCTATAVDSRYAKIMRVMEESSQHKPQMRRIAEQLGAFYTPLAVLIATIAWIISGEASRFLAVLVVATPCPLLISIPVCIIGAISLCARKGIIVRNPAAMEMIPHCKQIVFDKTGTLTYGKPKVTAADVAAEFNKEEVIAYAASLENYSKHPLALAMVEYAKNQGLSFFDVSMMQEKPGEGLTGTVNGRHVRILGRKHLSSLLPDVAQQLPPTTSGLECFVTIDNHYAATFKFHDAPRNETNPFLSHLTSLHRFDSVSLLSGDRESEVMYFAKEVGITDIHANKSPEEKVEIVKALTKVKPTIYVGDGINDAPSLSVATVGIAIGQNSEVTSEAADAVVMDVSLTKVDEFMHISERTMRIAKQSSIGGIFASVIGMGFASFGYLTPVAGAVAQEVIDLFSVLNALRAAFEPSKLSDF